MPVSFYGIGLSEIIEQYLESDQWGNEGGGGSSFRSIHLTPLSKIEKLPTVLTHLLHTISTGRGVFGLKRP
jgi:hypothetical protein